MRFILFFGFVYGLEVLPVCPIKPPEKLVFESNGVVPRTEIKSFEIHESLNHYNPSGDYVGLFVVSVKNSGKWGEYNDIHPGTIIMIDKKDLDGFGRICQDHPSANLISVLRLPLFSLWVMVRLT